MSNICSEQPGMKTYISGALAWILLICTILYLNVCTPPLSDDWAYNCGEWKNIIPDTWNEYFAWNPRVTGTMFTRIFALLPNGIVDVINTLMVPLMFMYVVRIAIGNNWKQAFSHWLTPCILWGYTLFMLIYPGQVLFWHCGVASYYFPMVLGIMLVDAFVDSLKKGEIWNPSLPRLAGWCLIAVLGSMGTFNLAGAIFLLGCFLMVYLHFQQGGCIWKMPIHQWKLSLILILIVLCQVLVVISPANDIRMQCTPPEEIGNIFNGGFYRQTRDFMTNVLSYKVFRTEFAYIFVLVCFIIRRFTTWTRQDAYMVYGFVALFIIAQASLYLSPVQTSERVYAPPYVFMWIAAFRIVYPVFFMKNFFIRWGIRAYIILWLLLTLPAVSRAIEQKIWWDNAEPMLRENEQDVMLPYCPLLNNYMSAHGFFVDYGEKDGKNQICRVYSKNTVRISDQRCTYDLGNNTQLIMTDTSRRKYGLYNPIGGKLHLENPSGEIPSVMTIWYPSPSRFTWLAPSAVWARLCHGTQNTADAAKLQAMGYVQETITNGSLEWEMFPKSWNRPLVPDIWVENADSSSFSRIEGKPDWHK